MPVYQFQINGRRVAQYQRPYAETCLPDVEYQRGRLEQLRYRFCGYRFATRVMQRLGNIGRAWFPWIRAARW